MAFSYDLSSTNATTLAISQVRLLIPDNDATAYDLADAEVTYFLTEAGNNITAAAVLACEQLGRKYAKQATFSADGLSVQYGERARLFGERAMQLRATNGGAFSQAALSREDGFSAATTGKYDTVFYTYRK